jgi:hypothetical protein
VSPEHEQNPAEQETRTCPQCQAQFTVPPPSRRQYCSPRCRDRAAAPPRQPAAPHTCPVCEGEFLAEPRLRQVYCSPTCRNEADRRRGAVRDQERARRLGHSARPPASQAAAGTVFGGGDALAPAATRNCPHCQQPITIVALLATPEAARPHITQPGADVIALKRA